MMKDRSCEISRKRLLLSLVIIIDFFIIVFATKSTTIVHTTSGRVKGKILTTHNSIKYAAFKGIRYAKAPIGYLRFKPPVAVDPWNGIVHAFSEGDDCTQMTFNGNEVRGSEDCLFINVFTPVTNLQSMPAKLKSVMVWIHGGAYTTGTSSITMYNPKNILEKDIVYVSLNYRLGALGFLSLSHPNATGNAGLKDQNLALKWVKANIAKFGGNPKNVTLFGHSAGGACVGCHVLSDTSTDLFHGAISMSGVPLNPWAFHTPERALSQAVKLGALLGTNTIDKTELLETFYRATAAEIVTATTHITGIVPPFAPTLEDESIATDVFLSTCPVTKYKTGNYTKVPQMLGFMDRETIYWLGAEKPFIEVVTYCIDYANKIGMPLSPSLDAVRNLINSGNNFYNQLNPTILNSVINETTDILYISQIDQTHKFLAANNDKPVYYYHVSFYTDKSLHNVLMKHNLRGPGHTDDLPYIFYFPVLKSSTDPTEPMTLHSQRYIEMFTNFVKYGNPTPNWINNNSGSCVNLMSPLINRFSQYRDELHERTDFNHGILNSYNQFPLMLFKIYKREQNARRRQCNLNVTWPDSGPSGISLDIGFELTVGPRPTSANTKFVQSFTEPLLETIAGWK